MRIDKYLSDSTDLSRKDIKKHIKNGNVSLGGAAVKDGSVQIDPQKDTVELFGKPIKYQKYIYLMMNKPGGYISATYDKRLPVVTELIDKMFRHFEPFPVGRLDIDTHGLLLLTNDGELAHRLLSPKTHVPKVYYAETAREINHKDIAAFESGMDLGDFTAMPALLKPDEKNAKAARVTIYEGKFHQIKRMFEYTGNEVTYLKRLSMGSLSLDAELKEGECRELTADELAALNI